MKTLLQILVATCVLTSAWMLAAPADAAIIAHYAFDGSLTADSSGNGRTLSSSTNGPTLGAPKFGSNSLSLSGATQFMYRGDNAFDFGTGDFAVSLWYQRSSAASFAIIGNGNSNELEPSADPESGFTLRVSGASNSPTLSLYEGSVQVLTANVSMDDVSNFQHVVIQREAGNYQLYVNNDLKNQNQPALASVNTDLAFGIGAENVTFPNSGVQASNFFGGLIDEVFIYNNALSPEHIDEIFTTNNDPIGGPSFSSLVPEPGSLVALLGTLFCASLRRRRK